MKNWVRVYFIILALFWLAPELANAQEKTMDEAAWQEITEGVDYTEVIKERKDDAEKGGIPDLSLGASVFKYFFFGIVLAVLIYFLVRYLLTLQGTAKAEQEIQVEVADLRQAEENLLKANLVKLIESLVAQKKYREATRAYFLLVLQRLHNQGLIEWKKPKTNFDYVYEVADKSFGQNFSSLTYYFELIWYGQQDVDYAAFEKIQPQFNDLLTQLQGNEK